MTRARVRAWLREGKGARARPGRRRCRTAYWVLGIPPHEPDRLYDCWRHHRHRGPHMSSQTPGDELVSARTG